MMEKKAKQAVEKEKANWSKKVDEKTGAEYYYNSKSGTLDIRWTFAAHMRYIHATYPPHTRHI